LEHQTGDVTGFFAELQLEWPEGSMELSCMVTLFKEENATRATNIHVYNIGIFSRQGRRSPCQELLLLSLSRTILFLQNFHLNHPSSP
jgi:hypothetical protein